jgi:hypothetical protein
MFTKDKEQRVVYTAYCKDCDMDIANSSNQDKGLLLAAEHGQQENHEVVLGMTVKWLDGEIAEKDKNEHVAFCKVCRKNVAVGKNEGKVLRTAMKHCEDTKHELAFGVLVRTLK